MSATRINRIPGTIPFTLLGANDLPAGIYGVAVGQQIEGVTPVFCDPAITPGKCVLTAQVFE